MNASGSLDSKESSATQIEQPSTCEVSSSARWAERVPRENSTKSVFAGQTVSLIQLRHRRDNQEVRKSGRRPSPGGSAARSPK